jgi:cytochrome c oxidase assembly protein subunit 11
MSVRTTSDRAADSGSPKSLKHPENTRLALKLSVVSLIMVGFGFALVPLYDVFCKAMGIEAPRLNSQAVVDVSAMPDYSREITVEFFQPSDARFTDCVLSHAIPCQGSPRRAYHREILCFENNTDATIRGNAVYSVTPIDIGGKFHKI